MLIEQYMFISYQPRIFIIFTFLICISLYIGGCTAAPGKSDADRVITKHFEAKGYRVVELNTGNINAVPMGEKQYMGTPGYYVDVTSMTLEVSVNMREKPNFKPGQKITFKNARVLVRQHTGPDKEWVIANIIGISLP
ncbi:MAG: hypothetical protein HZB61_00350 [Nitrospirae bacterium]|nr:hypothetical protein [Nitrospirota bacterium]